MHHYRPTAPVTTLYTRTSHLGLRSDKIRMSSTFESGTAIERRRCSLIFKSRVVEGGLFPLIRGGVGGPPSRKYSNSRCL